MLRDELLQIWEIDRREVIDAVFHFEQGALILKPEHWDMQGWPPGKAVKDTPLLYECFDQGGWFYGLIDNKRFIGVVILENTFMGKNKDQIQLTFLHVSRDYRNKGLGRQLFEQARTRARERGAKQLYISATPSEHTINFYFKAGAVVTDEPDAALYQLEPEDIHLVCDVSARDTGKE